MQYGWRHDAIQKALTVLGRDNDQVLLWTGEERIATALGQLHGTEVVHLRLADGWSGWVMVRSLFARRAS